MVPRNRLLFQVICPPNWACLTPLEPQSRFGDKLLEIGVVCPQNGTAVQKGVKGQVGSWVGHLQHARSKYHTKKLAQKK